MTARPASAEDGFSLIEMMAALTVLAIAGLALVNMTAATTRNTAAVQERALATIAAENVLNMQILRETPPQSAEGEYALGGVDYAWALEVAATDDADLLRLHLVLREAGSERVAVELDTFRRPRG